MKLVRRTGRWRRVASAVGPCVEVRDLIPISYVRARDEKAFEIRP